MFEKKTQGFDQYVTRMRLDRMDQSCSPMEQGDLENRLLEAKTSEHDRFPFIFSSFNGLDFSQHEFNNIIFIECDLRNVMIDDKTRFNNCVFRSCVMPDYILRLAMLDNQTSMENENIILIQTH